MKILKVTQFKPIQLKQGSFVYPVGSKTKIILDKKSPSHKKCHQLIYQQGTNYGSVGDCCSYLNNDELLDLEAKGMIGIYKAQSYKTNQRNE